MSEKYFIKPDELRCMSLKLARGVLDSGFIPDFMIALWRGGASIGMYMHEYFKYMGHTVDHIAIRTSKYTGIDQANPDVLVHNLTYPVERLTKDTKLLIVDDIFDTGHSCKAVLDALNQECLSRIPNEIKIATVFYKPTRNKTTIIPDYYVRTTDSWVVFPHELEGLNQFELLEHLGFDIRDIPGGDEESDSSEEERVYTKLPMESEILQTYIGVSDVWSKNTRLDR
jgi:hypoxanthine phosphoribosyltransferase